MTHLKKNSNFDKSKIMRKNKIYVGCELEEEITAKIGKNKTNEKVFTQEIRDENDNMLLSFYTYRGEVCVIDEEMMDVNFNTYSEETKKIIHEQIMNEKYSL